MVVFGLELAVEPAGEIADRLGHNLFGILGRRLPGRAVARDVDRHAILVVIAAPVADFRSKLVEIPPLDGLQPVGDAVQRRVLGRVVPDARGRALGVGPIAFQTGPIPLAPETGEPNARLLARAAAHQPDGCGLQADAEDFTDPLEIVIDRVPPIVVGAKLAIPAARFFLGDVGEFRELVDCGADDLRCRNGAAARR